MADLHALITEMAAELDHCQQLLLDDRRQRHPLADHARAALAESDGPAVPEGREPASVATQPSEPEAVGPTDEQLTDIADETPWRGSPRHFGREVARATLARWGRPAAAPVPGASNTYFEFVVLDGYDCTQAAGTAPTYAQALSEGQHYLAQYQQDGPHTLELRRVEVLNPNALPLPAPEGGEVSR